MRMRLSINKNLNHFKDYPNVIIVDPLKELLSDEENFIDFPKGHAAASKI